MLVKAENALSKSRLEKKNRKTEGKALGSAAVINKQIKKMKED